MVRHPSWWIRGSAIVIIGFGIIVGFYAGMGTIAQNLGAPGIVFNAVGGLLPTATWRGVVIGAVTGAIVGALLYLALALGVNQALRRGLLGPSRMIAKTGDVTIALTGVEAKAEAGSVSIAVEDGAVGTESAVVDASPSEPLPAGFPSNVAQFLFNDAAYIAASRQKYYNAIFGSLTFSGDLQTKQSMRDAIVAPSLRLPHPIVPPNEKSGQDKG
jgi:hypothetical protein